LYNKISAHLTTTAEDRSMGRFVDGLLNVIDEYRNEAMYRCAE